jgi:hypothetical protein
VPDEFVGPQFLQRRRLQGAIETPVETLDLAGKRVVIAQ